MKAHELMRQVIRFVLDVLQRIACQKCRSMGGIKSCLNKLLLFLRNLPVASSLESVASSVCGTEFAPAQSAGGAAHAGVEPAQKPRQAASARHQAAAGLHGQPSLPAVHRAVNAGLPQRDQQEAASDDAQQGTAAGG